MSTFLCVKFCPRKQFEHTTITPTWYNLKLSVFRESKTGHHIFSDNYTREIIMYKHVVNLLLFSTIFGYLLGGIQQQNYNNGPKMPKHVGGLPHVCILLSHYGAVDTHTHTHTHIYIYICVCVCVCMGIPGMKSHRSQYHGTFVRTPITAFNYKSH